jgi:hypothetical protein
VKFPKYGLKWSASSLTGSWFQYYRFDNYPLNDDPLITEYNKKYKRMWVPLKDSLSLYNFYIDKFSFNKSNKTLRDSIVPITVGIVFFSKGYVDTLILNGDYDYFLQDPNNIIQKNKVINYNAYGNRKINKRYLYTCSGKKILINNNIHSLGTGLYFNYGYNRKYLIMNGSTFFTR